MNIYGSKHSRDERAVEELADMTDQTVKKSVVTKSSR